MRRFNYSQIEKLTEGKDKTVAEMIEQTTLAINSAEENLRSHLSSLTSTVAQLQEGLAAGHHLGGLGSAPAEIDRLVAVRAIHWQNLGSLIGTEAASALATSKA